VHIRALESGDEAALSEICLKTADLGEDGSALYSSPILPGLVWAVPYLHGPTATGLVVADGKDALGYIVGAFDTERFEAWQTESWWPEARLRLGPFKPQTLSDRAALAEMSAEPLPQFARDYPAHFHIDLLPGARSHGFGRRLIVGFCDLAKASGAGGVHLGVARRNTNAIGFYRHMGFQEIAPDNIDEGGLILAKRLA